MIKMERWFCVLILAFLKNACAQRSCDYFIRINPGEKYSVANDNYPYNYVPGKSCSWTMTTTANAKLVLQCSTVRLASSFYQSDYLSVVKNGDFNNQQRYTNPFNTEGNSLTLRLIANSYYFSYGGTFFCEVRSVEVVKPAEKCDCGWSYRTRIVGGVETGVNEFPSMAALVNRNGIHSGAVIIASRVAMTAAHTIDGRNASELALLIGEHDISTGSETDVTKLLVLIDLIMHEKYTTDTELYDIGLVITEKEIPFSAKVGPACLPFNLRRSLVGETVTVTGWGSTYFAGPMSNVLLKTYVRVVDPQRCIKEYNYYSVDQNLCTFARGRDACQFDSGGPLYLKNPSDSRFYVVGVVNRGKGCASDSPAVNARVTYFLDWIDSKVPSANFCVK